MIFVVIALIVGLIVLDIFSLKTQNTNHKALVDYLTGLGKIQVGIMSDLGNLNNRLAEAKPSKAVAAKAPKPVDLSPIEEKLESIGEGQQDLINVLNALVDQLNSLPIESLYMEGEDE